MSGRKPSVVVIGAGVSGLCAVIKLRKELDLDTITVFEAESGLGGTWFVNTYPGCACDVPSHLYSFSFEPNPNWTTHYASQPEILKYLQGVAEKYDVVKHIQFNTMVKEAIWEEEEKRWKVSVQRKGSDTMQVVYADVVISGAGALRIPKIPDQFKNFKGPIFHTAEWNHKIDLKGKTVALIGSGASSIQAVPVIAQEAEKLYVYQRTPSWIVPRRNYAYPGWVKSIFNTFPIVTSLWRSFIFLMNEVAYLSFERGSWLNSVMGKVACGIATKHLNTTVPDEELREQLRPRYSMGCKRILVSNDYYPAMSKPNVELITEPIKNVTAKGIQTTKGEVQPDVLVAATGFAIEKFLSPMTIKGRGTAEFVPKENMDDMSVQSYLGINIHGFPNFFLLLGPNTGLGHNSVIFMIECQMDFIIQGLKEMINRDLSSLDVKEEAQRKVHQELQCKLKNTVFTSGCDSWYSNIRGEIFTLWAGNCISYYNSTKHFNLGDFETTSRTEE